MLLKCSKRSQRERSVFLVISFLLTILLGTMTGCSSSAVENTRESSATFTVMSEEMEEEHPATLYTAEGYSLYVMDEDWAMMSPLSPDSWYAKANDDVRFWISNYEGLRQSQVERILTNQGYQVENGYLWKIEGDIMYKVLCRETETDVWTWKSVYPPEAEEDWGGIIQSMFETFQVEEGYHVSEHTEKAVMPEGQHPQLYEVTYTDETSRAWALQEPEYQGSYLYNELTISNVTDSTFDFIVTRRDFETDETEVIIPLSTAHINEDMISATYTGEDYILTFDFSEHTNPLPVVLIIKLWGVDSLEGILFYNDSIPGFEAG